MALELSTDETNAFASGHEIGPFRAIEESVLSWLTPKDRRSDTFAWYTLLGSLGLALGTMVCGWAIDTLIKHDHWDTIQAYRGVFFFYAILGGVKGILAVLLSRKCEIEKKADGQGSETAPLLAGTDVQPAAPKKRTSLLPTISKDSVPTVAKLGLLFALDSFASGLVSM